MNDLVAKHWQTMFTQALAMPDAESRKAQLGACCAKACSYGSKLTFTISAQHPHYKEVCDVFAGFQGGKDKLKADVNTTSHAHVPSAIFERGRALALGQMAPV